MRRSSSYLLLLAFACSSLALFVADAGAARRQEPFSVTAAQLAAMSGAKAAVPARPAAGPALVAVNQAWTGTLAGTIVTVGAGSFTFGTDAFATIQAGVDAVEAGGTVKVLPGTYSEIAPGSMLFDASGPYQFGVFVGVGKDGITVEGVDAGGTPIASAAGVATTVNYTATNSFGTSGFFVEADHVTFQGLGIGSQLDAGGTNKTFEVIGDDFTLRNCTINDNYGGSVYLDDWRATMTTSWVQSYHITGNVFIDGNSIDIASGPGVSGPASGRVISGNDFTMTDIYNSISFNGTTPAVGWFIYPVGGAVITGNAFHNSNPTGTIIRARGTYDNSQFDWAGMWTGNAFDRAACEGVAPPADVRGYAYSVYTNARHIGSTIQGQVDHSVSGDVVLVRAGAYPEQVVVNGLDLTIQGAGRAATTIQSPATLAASFGGRKPILLFENAASVQLKDVTVDGLGLGNANYAFTGVGFWNAGGKVIDCDVVRVRETPFNGNQHGLAIYATNNTGGPYAIEVGGCNVSDYQKNGITLNGAGLTADVHDCTVTGQGQTSLNAQNGVQLYGSSGTVTHCTVSGNFYTGSGYTASGMLLWGPSAITVSGSTLSGNQTSVYVVDVNGAMSGTSITAASAPSGFGPLAVELYNTFTTTLANKAGGGHVPPAVQPVTDADAKLAGHPNSTLSNLMTFDVTGGCITGPGTAGTQGIDVFSDGADLHSSITGVEVSGWEWGIGAGGAGGVSVDANHNAITGNSTAGYYFYGPGAATNLAARNWWGNAGGPGAGGANGVLGAGVVSAPWLITGADANPGCGFTAGSDNVVNVGPAPSCISNINTCVTIPVTVARTTSDNVRGYSVTFSLSSNLALCSGTASVLQGSYLSSVAGTHFEVVDNLDGTYTVDCAILGSTCGATAASGQLFTLAVMKAGLDGPGTITVTSVVMRDCDNGPVAASAGAPLVITVDTGAPTAIATLAAAQRKTGNDGSGTTQTLVTFTTPPTAVTIEVYRAGFGYYPEYDDAGGAAPVAPGYPPAAPWTLTSVTASGQYDHAATRDFWYYVAFSKDECGNVSAVSNRTAGTLGYHLGDVVDPGAPLSAGDNVVDGADISRLGAHYGISLALNAPYNYLDVGRTTDYSVNALPTTDNRVGFEDLMMFAINYSVVSAPQMAARPTATNADALALGVPELPAAGGTFAVSLRMQGSGAVQGASVQLAFDPNVVEPVGVEAGGLLMQQGCTSLVLSPEPGTVDFALLGEGQGIRGEGEAARMLFRVKAAGNPGIALGTVIARDGANAMVSLQQDQQAQVAPVPARTELGNAFPNPFGRTSSVQLSLAREGHVRVALYDLAGRRVRTLMDNVQPAGVRMLSWDGRSEAGLRMAPGVYVMRLETAGVVQSRRLQFIP